jgi:hypothetical protein
MPDVDESEREFRERLTAILRATPPLMGVLAVARHLCLPDCLVFSGAVYQPVFNHLTGRPSTPRAPNPIATNVTFHEEFLAECSGICGIPLH